MPWLNWYGFSHCTFELIVSKLLLFLLLLFAFAVNFLALILTTSSWLQMNKFDKKGKIAAEELEYLAATAHAVEKAHQQLAWSYCFRYFMSDVRY